MQPDRIRGSDRATTKGGFGLIAAVALLINPACETAARTTSQTRFSRDTAEIMDADTGFTLTAAPTRPAAVPLQPPDLAVDLNILHIQIPAAHRALAEKVWNHQREDVLDSETMLRLRQNGVRVGIGREESWGAVKAALDAIEGHRVVQLDPVRVPAGYPLGLELDLAPREQTLFFVDNDGIISGATWPHSRNALRVSHLLDPRHRERVHLLVVPEVRQRLSGWRWMRTEGGFWAQVPRQDGRAFPAAGFSVPLDPGEFVLLAPSPYADTYGLVGGAFLTEEIDGVRYDSYVFLRPVIQRGDRDDR